MSSIDDRVVNMQFNNAQFEQGVDQTTKSIAGLKDSLKLDGATSGIDAVQAASNRFSLQNMESALQNISSKFSVLGAVGLSAINYLVTGALDAGKNIAAGLIDPLVNGGAKRALALQQAKFQFQGLGLDIQATMDAALGAVRGTAFGLDDAATAAAQFGASGITAGNGLETVLRSVAGVAAQTGSGYSSIAQIFETIAGNGRLMGQQLTQLSSYGVNAAATLGKSLGKSEEEIRDLVSTGDISFQQFSDAMNEAFGANAAKANETFTGALANMHAALARIGADVASPYFLGMRDIFNALGPMFDRIHDALAPVLSQFGTLFGLFSAGSVDVANGLQFDGLLIIAQGVADAMANVFNAVKQIGVLIRDAFGDIFPPVTAKQFESVAQFLRDFSEALIPTTATAEQLSRVFKGVFAVFDIVGQAVGALISAFAQLFGYTAEGSDAFLEIAARVGDFLVKLDDAIRKGTVFQTFFKGLAAIIAVPIGILKTFFGIIGDGIETLTHLKEGGDNVGNFVDKVKDRFQGLFELAAFFQGFWNGVVTVAKAVWGFLQPIFEGIGEGISTAVTKVKAALSGLKFDDAIKAINTGLFAGFLAALNGFFGNLGGILQGNKLSFVTKFNLIFGSLRTNLKALEMNTNAKTLTQIAIAVALLAASAVALSLVDPAKLGLALAAIGGLMKELLLMFEAFSKLGGQKGVFTALAIASAMQVIAGAILVLAIAIAILGAIPLPNLIQGVLALVVVLGALVGALNLMAKIGPNILAAAGAIAIMAPALALLAGVIAILGALPVNNLIQGMLALVIVLAALVGTLQLLGDMGPKVLFGAGAIAIIAPALAILTGAVAALGALPLVNLIAGMAGLVVMLAAITGAVLLLGFAGPQALLGAVAISAIALSLVPLIGAVALLGALPIPNIISGIVALTAVLVVLTGIILLLGFTGPVALLGAAAIVAVALAIAILAPALAILAAIPWEGIGKVMTVLSAGLGILAVMGILLIPASVGFLLLGAAILLIGTGVFLAAEGVGLLAVGIGLLVGIGGAGILLFTQMLTAFMQQLPALGAAIGEAIVSMVVVIGQKAPDLVNAFVALLLAMLDAVQQVVPKIVEVATTIIISLVNALVILLPALVTAGLQIISGILKGIASNIGEIAKQGINIIVNFINGVSSKLGDIINAGINLIISFVNGLANGIRDNRSKMVAAGLNLADAITGGMSTGLVNGINTVVNAAKRIANAIPAAIKKVLGINSPSKVTTGLGEWTGEGAALGIENKYDRVEAAAGGIGDSAIAGLKNSLAGAGDILSDSMDSTPTIRPVLDLSAIQAGAKNIPGMLPTPSLSLDTSNDVATSVSLQEQARNAVLTLEANNPSPDSKSVTFIQNNNSPKALSTSEVYRQTQNQLSTLKGELGVVDQSGSPK